MSASVKRRIFSGKLLLLVLLILGVALYYLDAALTRGPSAEEKAAEEQLWNSLSQMKEDSSNYFEAVNKLRGQINGNQNQDTDEEDSELADDSDDEAENIPAKNGASSSVYSLALEARKLMGIFDRQLVGHREHLEKTGGHIR